MEQFNRLVQEAMDLLDTIYMATDAGVLYLKERKIDEFQHMVTKREKLLSRFRQIQERVNQDYAAGLKGQEIAEINKKIKSKIQIIAKVDREAIDIINCIKKDLLNKMKQGTSGKMFLRQYREQVNHRKIIQRTI